MSGIEDILNDYINTYRTTSKYKDRGKMEIMCERECLKKPCKIMFEGKPYTSFTNSWSLVLTTEDTGEIELFDNENGKYPEVGRLVNFDGIKRKVDLNAVFAEAKCRGYKLTKKEVGPRIPLCNAL